MTRRFARTIATILLGALVLAAVGVLVLNAGQREAVSADTITSDATDLDASTYPGIPASPAPGVRTVSEVAGEPNSTNGSAPGETGDLRTLAAALRNADRLRAEDTILVGDDLSADAAGPIITTDRFGETLGRLEEQMLQDPMARELTEAYRHALQTELSSASPTMELDRLACGMRVCMALIQDQAEVSDWVGWMESLSSNPDVPFYASLDYSLDHGGAGFEHRLIFSTDPSSSGVRVMPSPQP